MLHITDNYYAISNNYGYTVARDTEEEIEHEIMKNKEVGRKQCEGMARAMNIIRSHMDDVTDTNVPSNWIPCSEQLPEEDSFEYIISCSDGITRTGVSYGYAKDEDKEPCFYKYDDEYWNCYRYNNVVAWQPLLISI